MKKVNILCVGKIKEKYFTDAIAEYGKRLSRYCELNIIEIPDECGTDEVKKESEVILKKMRGYTVLMDICGKAVSSPDISELLDRAYVTSPEVTFIIGGSCGVDERVRASANERISFGKVTYPHQLMRVILCEQIYRGFNILAGTPYHK